MPWDIFGFFLKPLPLLAVYSIFLVRTSDVCSCVVYRENVSFSFLLLPIVFKFPNGFAPSISSTSKKREFPRFSSLYIALYPFNLIKSNTSNNLPSSFLKVYMRTMEGFFGEMTLSHLTLHGVPNWPKMSREKESVHRAQFYYHALA